MFRGPARRDWTVAAAVACLCSWPAVTSAHDDGDHAPHAAQPAEIYKPTLLPDRIILTWTDDPATTQAVSWRTSTEVPKGCAEIAPAEAGPAFAKKGTRVPATSQALLTDLNTAHFHTVNFEGLTPATALSGNCLWSRSGGGMHGRRLVCP
jgi:hypothetical protein